MGKKMCSLREKGFSIIELLIMLAIVGILAAIAVPGFLERLPKYRLNGAARQIMTDLIWVRMQAVSENNEFKVFILSDNKSYTILDDDNNNGTADTGEWSQTYNIQDNYYDVTISQTADLVFYPRGIASSGKITVTNSSGTREVKISIAGRVKIEE